MKTTRHDRSFGLLYIALLAVHLAGGGYVLWLGYQQTLDWPKAGLIGGAISLSMIFSLCRLMMSYACKECDHILLPPKGWARCTLTGSTVFHCWRCNTDWHTGLLAPDMPEVHQLSLNAPARAPTETSTSLQEIITQDTHNTSQES